MDGRNGRVEEEMGAQGLEGRGKGSLVTLPPSVVSLSWGTELAVRHWVLLHRPHTSAQQVSAMSLQTGLSATFHPDGLHNAHIFSLGRNPDSNRPLYCSLSPSKTGEPGRGNSLSIQNSFSRLWPSLHSVITTLCSARL